MSKLTLVSALTDLAKSRNTHLQLRPRYYFVEGHSLNDRPLLAKTVSQELTNLLQDKAPTEVELLDFLNGSEGRKEIIAALNQLQILGVHSIPKFIIGGSLLVDGAAHSNTFVKIFREIEQVGNIGGPAFSDILGISGEVIQQGSHCTEVISV
jgi:hypothetical protein